MPRSEKQPGAAGKRPLSKPAELLCHFGLWFGLLFATPVFVATHNTDDLVFSVPTFALWAGAACLLATGLSWGAAAMSGGNARWWVSRAFLTAALILAVQGNFVHGLFDYGAFNGERVDYSDYGWKYWSEFFLWLAAWPLGLWLLTRVQTVPAWLAAIPLLSFALLVFPAFFAHGETPSQAADTENIDPAVFEFSSTDNLIHLLPDGFQGDVVRQVFEERPELAAKFRGFTLFTNHVSTNQGTAPVLYTMLTGEAFDLQRGWTYPVVGPHLRKNSYAVELSKAGYRLDYVPISGFICPEMARTCIARPFNDMKARGIYRHRSEDVQYSIRLIGDLSLFRLTPMYLKERIHNDGRWFLADTTMDGSSPWPDPVIREWTENLRVSDEAPVYKWHHFVGTHVPAQWDESCRLLDKPAVDRTAYLGQAGCVLAGIGKLLDRLDEAGIYDQTAMIISGDHGHNVAADDAVGIPLNRELTPGLHGQGRPALLVKQKGSREALAISDRPTSVMDVHASALELAGLQAPGPSVFNQGGERQEPRHFRVYRAPDFYTGKPIPYIEFSVGPDAKNAAGWAVSDIQTHEKPPPAYDPVNRPNGKDFIYGADLRKSPGNNSSSWVTGRQLAFLVGVPDTTRDRYLELSLHIPDWVGEQSFRAEINGRNGWRSPVLSAADGEWQTVRLPFPASAQHPDRNFVSLVFERLERSPEREPEYASARIRSIRTVEAAQPFATHQ